MCTRRMNCDKLIISPIPDIAVNRATNLWNKLVDVYCTQSESAEDGIKEMRGASKCGYGDMYTIDYAMFPVQESCVLPLFGSLP